MPYLAREYGEFITAERKGEPLAYFFLLPAFPQPHGSVKPLVPPEWMMAPRYVATNTYENLPDV